MIIKVLGERGYIARVIELPDDYREELINKANLRKDYNSSLIELSIDKVVYYASERLLMDILDRLRDIN